MSRDLPVSADIWRLVEARRAFSGTWPLSRFKRLANDLADTDGDVNFALQFDTDQWANRYAELELNATLTLICQRSLAPFELPVTRQLRLGLIESEDQEAALPEGYEAYLVTDPAIRLADLLEDELILALPVVALDPAGERTTASSDGDAPNEQRENPFAALAELKGQL